MPAAPYRVLTYVASVEGHLVAHPFVRFFHDPKAAERYAVEEMKWESTVAVVIPELGTKVEGDFVSILHRQELYAQVPAP